MKQFILAVIMSCLPATLIHAEQSIITDGDGYACMGDDKSRKGTETTAMADANRKATESVEAEFAAASAIDTTKIRR